MSALFVEALESRIAPAGVAVKGNIATWLDWDGDTVTVKWTGSQAPQFLSHAPDGMKPDHLIMDEVQLSNRADVISVTVTAAPGGDGRVDLGYINAAGTPLKSFTAPRASVLQFDVGDGVKGIDSLVLGSYGTVSPSVFQTFSMKDGVGTLNGQVLTVKIAGDIAYGGLSIGVNASTPGKSVSIGGNLRGAVTSPALTSDYAGFLTVNSPMDSITIGGSVIGGSTAQSGKLAFLQTKTLTVRGAVLGGDAAEAGNITTTGGSSGAVTLGGSVIGGAANKAGYVALGTVSTLKMGGDLVAGTATNTGVLTGGGAKSFTMAGSVVGGTPRFGGILNLTGTLGSVTVGGDLRGGIDESAGVIQLGDVNTVLLRGSIVGAETSVSSIFASSAALSVNSAKSITIGRDIIAGTGQLLYNGGIFALESVGKLTIGGSLLGNASLSAQVIVAASPASEPGNVAIGQLVVKGSLDHALIDVGNFPPQSLPSIVANPEAKIGSVKITGNFIASSIMAGVSDGGKRGVGPMTGDDSTSGNSSIGPVTIGGGIFGDPESTFGAGFEAKAIAKITVGGATVFKAGDARKALEASLQVIAAEI